MRTESATTSRRPKAGALAFYAAIAGFMIWWVTGVQGSNSAWKVRDAAEGAARATIAHRNRTGEWPTAAAGSQGRAGSRAVATSR